MPTWESISDSASDKVRDLHEWWTKNRGVSGIPDRSAFDPTDFTRLLPNMLIAEVEQLPFRFRYRLIGTKVAEVLNLDFTGRRLDELVDEASGTPWLGSMDGLKLAEAVRDRWPPVKLILTSGICGPVPISSQKAHFLS